jgi:hypothetical protein
MNILSLVVQRTRAAINRRRFVERELAAILKTPPVVLGKDAFTALSMVHHRDVESYLLAIKSFCRFMHPRRIVMVADPSITDADRSRIASHVIGIEIVRAEDYQEPGMPQGGTWERLMAISEYSQSDYVIQIDADTVTLSEMAEVKKAIAEATSFALATEDGQQLVSCVEAARGPRRGPIRANTSRFSPKPIWIACPSRSRHGMSAAAPDSPGLPRAASVAPS